MTTTLADRIDLSYAELSPQEQRAADFLRDHLADLAVYNATEVAHLSGVSKATISRLYRRLGFESAEELRDHVRELRSSGVPVASSTPANYLAHLDRELANLRAALSGLDLGEAARTIAEARRVVVIGFRNSFPVALHLREQLAQARGGVELAPVTGQSIGEELAGLTTADAVVLIGFRRRPQLFTRLLAAVTQTGAASILLVDPSGRRSVGPVDIVIEVPIESVTAFDSYAAAMSVVSLLAAAVLAENVGAGRARIASIGSLYSRLEEQEG
jgi:DNA-binding MurR/RpiR family transcriptional regulator